MRSRVQIFLFPGRLQMRAGIGKKSETSSIWMMRKRQAPLNITLIRRCGRQDSAFVPYFGVIK